MSALTYIIFVVVALLACGLGAVGAYFYYRARHREAVAELEALDQDLADREEELHRLQYQFTNAYPDATATPQTERQAEMQQLREELEQKKNDYNILKQDFDLEIGILKQELNQLKEEKTNVEHTRRHLVRKDADLEEREKSLKEREEEVDRRTATLDEEMRERTRVLEEDLAERDRRLRARRVAIEEEREGLERDRKAVSEAQARVDQELLELPSDKFTSRQEGLLIKRLRQQIKLQRDELERLQRMYHDALRRLNEVDAAPAESETNVSSPIAKPEKHRGEHKVVQERRAAPERDVPGEGKGANRSRREPDLARETFGRDEGDSFPAFSTLSSYVDADESPDRSEFATYEQPFRTSQVRSEGADDLTSLPGLNPRIQNELNELGITSFDQIARWSSADVRRISERLNVDRKTIQDHWIINAQSHLFSRQKSNYSE